VTPYRRVVAEEDASGASAAVIPASTSARAVSSPADSSCATITVRTCDDERRQAIGLGVHDAHALAAIPLRRAAAAAMRVDNHLASMDSSPRVRRRSRISELG